MWKISFKVETVGPTHRPYFGGVRPAAWTSQSEKVERLCLRQQFVARKSSDFRYIEEACVAFLQQIV
jgi:hypothetical protein